MLGISYSSVAIHSYHLYFGVWLTLFSFTFVHYCQGTRHRRRSRPVVLGVLIKREKQKQEITQAYWIRKAEQTTTTQVRRSHPTPLATVALPAADHTPPRWPPLHRPPPRPFPAVDPSHLPLRRTFVPFWVYNNFSDVLLTYSGCSVPLKYPRVTLVRR